MPLKRVCAYCRQSCEKRPCEHCGKPTEKDYSRRPTDRESAHKRGYDHRWRKWRETVIKRAVSSGKWDGRCARCGQFILRTIHADHIEPVQSKDDPRFYDLDNIQFLHPACHSAKTVEDTQKGRTRDA